MNKRNEILEQLHPINEDSQLYSGIFWIKDINNISSSDLYFQVPVDMYGNPQGDTSHLNAKSGTTFNHEKTWKDLQKSVTNNKSFDYYPRGRVMIANNKATIWANPNICNDELKSWCISKFNLNKRNGINRVDLKPDFSNHYKCHLD